ncbi:putative signal peptide protein [Caulobacter phage Cr30]|uniref:signal peptide motif n=1 Tax=Caulobacter phage Cr30 TaxID=1357714 RepID=UPI0004A9B75A|nr:signal peptide motif [Caulobacter phage Cr30]AGS80943.1 putative signal peptide protein [Caulobacter phage Cr30]
MLTIISEFLKGIPLPWKILGFLLFCTGLVAFGYAKGNQRADERIAEYEQSFKDKKAVIDAGQVKINDRIVTKYVDRVKVIRDQEIQTNEIIKEIPKQELFAGSIYSHNLSAGWSVREQTSYPGYFPESSRASDETPSGVETSEFLSVINGNYTNCKANYEQLVNLQDWIRETQKNVEEANKTKNK